jgi:hypothetical protein
MQGKKRREGSIIHCGERGIQCVKEILDRAIKGRL